MPVEAHKRVHLHALGLELGSTAQFRQVDHEGTADHLCAGALEQLDRREDRSLGTADAEARRPERQRPAQQALGFGTAGARR